ncbi:MAG: hypothetical protein FJY75_02535 [Candidatus Eisenbacteria bacterium]|uniref:Uncharacterized protein n=1 Tax=Eiseniibacteriota bacterium TaxID=2212470 RepID=A0A937XA92_UNCEI|nr:hypothetical protein [Candidatus Eisenbacteria bacterium]
MQADRDDLAWAELLDQIRRGERSELERLALAFEWITDRQLAQGRLELERLRAIPDEPARLKEQIKLSTIEHCRAIFRRCRRLAAEGG